MPQFPPSTSMTNQHQLGRTLVGDLLMRPLHPARFMLAVLVVVALGTAYCQLYCLIAFQLWHGHAMPVGLSLAWAVTALSPWLLAFEIGKRALLRRPWTHHTLAIIAAAMMTGVIISVAFGRGIGAAIGIAMPSHVSMEIAHQLPRLMFTLAGIGAIGWASHYVRRPVALLATPECEQLPTNDIDWIRAAGNYIEIHTRGRILTHRMTMNFAEAQLDHARFARIHRSIIVNQDKIADVGLNGARPWLRLKDGTVLPVGTRYRHVLTDYPY